MPQCATGIFLCAALLFGVLMPVYAQVDQLVYMTEEDPPYNYVENGRLRGFSVELLLVITRELGQPISREQIRVLPWARAYRELQQEPSRVLFMTTRTPEREDQFQWAGPITNGYLALVAQRSKKLRLTRAAELKNLRVGIVRDDVAEEFLQKFNIDPGMVTRGNSHIGIAKMLVADRIDLWPIDPIGAGTLLSSVGAKPENYEVVVNISSVPLYFAFSQDVDAELVAAFQKVIDELRIKQPALFPRGHSGIDALDIPPLK